MIGIMSQKRQAEDDVFPVQRYTRIKLASPSPERSDGSDTESIHSCQGYATELVKDTSDTSSSPSYNFEYDVVDPEEPKGKFYMSDDTDDENVVELDSILSAVPCDTLDIALLGDTSEENSTSPTSNSDVDPGLPRNDYLDFEKCLLCQTDEKDISYPYCSTCFTWKKNLFPNRPKRHSKISKKNPENGISRTQNPVVKNTPKLIEINKSDSSQGNEKSSQESDELCEDSGVGSSGPQMSEDVVDAPSQGPSTSSSGSSGSTSRSLSLDMCRVCFLNPENGLFVHLNGAHVYGCYSCAKKIWYHSGGCPICRRKIFKVVKLYV